MAELKEPVTVTGCVSFSPALMVIHLGGTGKKAWLLSGLRNVKFERVCCCEIEVEVLYVWSLT